MILKILYAILVINLGISKNAWSAACCARNSATPFLIVGNDKAQVNMGYSVAGIVAKSNSEGIPYFKSRGSSEQIHTTRLDLGYLVTDTFQAGLGLPFVRNSLSESGTTFTGSGVGDVRFSIGYEILPYRTYSNWKPQGFLFSVLTLPTGISGYESIGRGRTDISGNGFYSVGIGNLWIKRWTLWDLFVVPELHYSFGRTFHQPGVDISALPGWGGSLGFGVGFSPGAGALRLGVRVQPRYDQGVASTAFGVSVEGKPISVCDTGFDASYLVSTHDTLMFSYSDQTLLGIALNTNLSRTLSFNYQHRWEL